jgi:flagellar biosynthesis chaperone FliJ
METALQEAIAKLKKERNKVHSQYFVSDDVQEMEELSNQLTGLDFAIKTNTNLLPKEREQIEQAYKQGNEKSWSAAPKTTAQEYYETNFNK